MPSTPLRPVAATDHTPSPQDPNWWRDAVVYQIYPRSFFDASGDGLGDLPGITAKVPYLASLGVDAVWLSPFYPSALADGGYDVDDYTDVDPRLGTLDDFDTMIDALHAAGMRLIVDIVPNHTSNRHRWFREALASPPGSPARDRYIFRDGTGPDGTLPPTDWVSTFGGPAWQQVADGQWYFHHFATEQPDLNWENPQVRAEFLRILAFWADRGVDGFRVDVAHGLTKNLTGPLPSAAELDEIPMGPAHPLWDRDEVQEIYAEWRALFNTYDPPRMAVAEAWIRPERRARYASVESLGQAFNFDLLRTGFHPREFAEVIGRNLAEAEEHGYSNTWVLSNHDVVRHATRYGVDLNTEDDLRRWLLDTDAVPLDRAAGLARATAATCLILALPGSTYIYQGEELGLHEVTDLDPTDRQDPTFFRSPGFDVGRDGCRVPLPWESQGRSLGFSVNPDAVPHLPQPAWFAPCSVAAESAAAAAGGPLASTLGLYRAALAVRSQLRSLAGREAQVTDMVADDDTLTFTRDDGVTVLTVFTDVERAVPDGAVLLASGPVMDGRLRGPATVWCRRSLPASGTSDPVAP